ncbi:MAG: hypothetical protein JEY99_14695 [Spirochaetales bacterium]|nr:hypothetical protein [Spirochaetales bacterium]
MAEEMLLEGISREARDEAEKILKQAAMQVEAKKKGFSHQESVARRDSQIEIDKQVAEIRKRSESSIKSSTRRASLKFREELYTRVLALSQKKVRGMIGTPGYQDFLARLIAEGVMGLNRDEAVVSVSHLEKLEPATLQMAAELVKSSTGRTVALSEGETLSSQGVAVASKDGRISFNNQISTRFRRYDQEIKKIVYDELGNKE